MSIDDFNRGLDDAYMGRCRDSKGNIDYEEGLQMGEDINARIDHEIEMKKEYDDYRKREQEIHYKNIQKVRLQALLNNTVDDDEAILLERELEKEQPK